MHLCAIWAASRTSCVNILGVWYYRRQGCHADVSASRLLHTRSWWTSRGIGKGIRKSAQLWVWNHVISGFICWERLLFRSFAGIFLTFLGKLPEVLCPVGPELCSSSCFLWHTLGELSVFSALSYHCAEDTIRVRTDPAPTLEEVIHRPLHTINLHSNWLPCVTSIPPSLPTFLSLFDFLLSKV